MKVRITVSPVGAKESWTEEYDCPTITTLEQAEVWAVALIAQFNVTCRPSERKRKLLKTEIVGVSTAHVWVKRTAGMSVEFRGRLVDLMYCAECGVTGKRYGLGGSPKRDSKYRAKKYAECSVKRGDSG